MPCWQRAAFECLETPTNPKMKARWLPLRFGHTSWGASVGSVCSCSSWRAPAGSHGYWAGWWAAGCPQDRCPESWLCSCGPSFLGSSCTASDNPLVTIKAKYWPSYKTQVVFPHIGGLVECLLSSAIVNHLYGHRKLDRFPLRNPNALRDKT